MTDLTVVDAVENKEENRARWATRRLMTWLILTFYFASIVYGLGFIKPDVLKEYTTIYNIISMVTMGVLGSYFGFATWDDVNRKKNFPTVSSYTNLPQPSVTTQQVTTKSYYDVNDTGLPAAPVVLSSVTKRPVHRPETP